jgi:uncharacterized MAPEG superfamily protein
MTPDLRYLALTAMLTASLWIPYVACQVMRNGFPAPSNYVDPAPRPVPLWGKRADRALMNGVEVLGGFAALVIVAHLAGRANAMTALWAALFFWARVAHALVYWFAIPYVRTIVFTLGYVSIVGIFWEIVR